MEQAQPGPPRHEVSYTFRVRYAETDAMGFAHHSSYILWMEMGRTEYMRAHGFTYRQLEELGVQMPVLELQARYRQPAYYDDELRITCWVQDLTRVRLLLAYTMVRTADETLLCESTTLHTFIGRDGRPTRITHHPEAWANLQSMV